MLDGKSQTLAVIVNLEAQGGLHSLFHVFAHSSLPYSSIWNYLQVLEQEHLVIVERSGSGIPLKITTTAAGRKAVAEHPWQLVMMETRHERCDRGLD